MSIHSAKSIRRPPVLPIGKKSTRSSINPYISISVRERGAFTGNGTAATRLEFLGLEIREPLVNQANGWRTELGLLNLHYLFCNVNNSLRPILDSLPTGVLRQVTIQFPDPWFKRKHQKRRVVQPETVAELADALCPKGVVLIQSDVEEVAVEMRDRFSAHPAFIPHQEQWLPTNPLAVPTERELSTLKRGEPVYRALFIKR